MKFKAGAFKALPTQHAITQTKNGKNQIAINFQLKEGPEEGKSITFFGGLEGKGVKFSLGALENCGWDAKKQPDFSQPFEYQEVVVVIEDDEYTKAGPNGDEKVQTSRVKYVNKVGGGMDLKERAIPAAEAKSLAASLSQLYLASQKEESAPPAKSVYSTGESAEGDNDIPF